MGLPQPAALPEYGVALSEGLEQGAFDSIVPRQAPSPVYQWVAHRGQGSPCSPIIPKHVLKNARYAQATGQGSNLSVWSYHVMALGSNCLA